VATTTVPAPCRRATVEAGSVRALPSPSAGCPPMMRGGGHRATASLYTPRRWEGGGGRCRCRSGGARWLRAPARLPAFRQRRVPVPRGACLYRCTRRVNLVYERVGKGSRVGWRGVPPLRRPPHGHLPHRIVRTAGSIPPFPLATRRKRYSCTPKRHVRPPPLPELPPTPADKRSAPTGWWLVLDRLPPPVDNFVPLWCSNACPGRVSLLGSQTASVAGRSCKAPWVRRAVYLASPEEVPCHCPKGK